MTELTLMRRFPHPPERVFAFVTKPEHLRKWWGPETMFIPSGDLDLSRLGPWSSVMENKDGGQFKVSGEVVAHDPPRRVVFTWAWHDPEDARGVETRVTFEVDADDDGGAVLTLTHSGFADAEAMGNHEGGWTSSLRKLEKMGGANG